MMMGNTREAEKHYISRLEIPRFSDADTIEMTDDIPTRLDFIDEKRLGVHPSSPERMDRMLPKRFTESVVEREIRLQMEREAEVAREREEALQKVPKLVMEPVIVPKHTSGNAAQMLIQMELREMHEREEELRRLRGQQTDEGLFLECSSDEKDGSNSCVLSPEVTVGENSMYQKRQSFDSMSSGHSSGLGELYSPRHQIIVKPLVEAEEETAVSYMRSEKETPIEKEIRVAQEREKELRRQHSLTTSLPATPTPYSTIAHEDDETIDNFHVDDSRSAEHRLATNRIQQEIHETAKREKELWSAGRIQTMSEDTLDSKVTRFTDLREHAIEERNRKLRKSVSSSNLPLAVSATSLQNHNYKHSSFTSQITDSNNLSTVPVRAISPKRFSPSIGKKGAMQKFLELHSRMNSTSPEIIPESEDMSLVNLNFDLVGLLDLENQEPVKRRSSPVPFRRGYQSAEVKIQAELHEMQKREEELSLQRMRHFAQSQPNLVFVGNEENQSNRSQDQINGKPEIYPESHEYDFYDAELDQSWENEKALLNQALQQNVRVRSHRLISEWESRIQKNINQH